MHVFGSGTNRKIICNTYDENNFPIVDCSLVSTHVSLDM